MQGRWWKGTILVATSLLAGSCREDGGTGPAVSGYVVPSNAQCVASHSGLAANGPSIVQSRLALTFAAAGPGDIDGRSGELACLSQEGGRWRIGRLAEAVP